MAASTKVIMRTFLTNKIASYGVLNHSLLRNSSYTPCRVLLCRNVFSKARHSFSSKTSGYRRTAFGLVTGAAFCGATFYQFGYFPTLQNSSTVHAESDIKHLNIPQFAISRKVKRETDSAMVKLTLFQYQTCPFCCKVRAFLDYYGFSYDVIEVNSVWRTQIKWSKYKKVPILVCQSADGQEHVMKDSSLIMSLLESMLEDRSQKIDVLHTYYPEFESKNSRGKVVYEYPNKYFIMYGDKTDIRSTEKQRKEERKWRRWTDEVLVHTLSPNVYQTPREALQAFNYFSEVGEWEKHFSTFERYTVIYVGATAMYILGKYLKRKYDLKDNVRESLYDACTEWTKTLKKKKVPFMGGESPNLADLSVYGVLSSIEGCDAFQDLLVNTDIRQWYTRTKQAVNSSSGAIVAYNK